MKIYLLLTFLFFNTMSAISQTPSGLVALDFGDTIHLDGVSIEFVELISDSRCPKNVTCIRAGEAKVRLAVYNNGKFSYEKTLIFYASGFVNQQEMQLFNSNDMNIQGLALYPYPVGIGKIVDSEYYLDLRIN